jgi:hypothetical protein
VTHLPRAPSAWLAAVAREHQLRFAFYADRRGLGAAEYRRRLLAHLRDLCGNVELRVRLRRDHLPTVFADRRLRNQFETGHSSGYFHPRIRAELEHRVLGVPLSAPPIERPIYGYLSGSDEDHALPSYGTVIATLDSSLRQRATFTVGDSLDQTQHARIPAFAPSPLNVPELLSVDARIDVLGARDFATASASSHRYAEAQIYGGVALEDISALEFTAGLGPDEALTRELQALGLPWKETS